MALRKPRAWTEFVHLRFTGRLKDGQAFDKTRAAEVVEACGFRTPKLLREFNSAAQIDFSGFPDAFVLKAAGLDSKRGLMVLRRAKDGRYWDILRKKHWTIESIREEEAGWEALWHRKRSGPFRLLAQEMIVGENGADQIPFDYLFHTLGGEVRVIAQLDRNVAPLAAAFWINEFEPFDYATRLQSEWNLIRRGEPRIPRCCRQMIEAAKAISRYLQTAFIRVDMFATAEGPVISELTRVPGVPYYTGRWSYRPEFDAELGRYWAEANERLGIETPLFDDAEPLVRKRPRFPSTLQRKKRPGIVRRWIASIGRRIGGA